jgi:hypothetical protein
MKLEIKTCKPNIIVSIALDMDGDKESKGLERQTKYFKMVRNYSTPNMANPFRKGVRISRKGTAVDKIKFPSRVITN